MKYKDETEGEWIRPVQDGYKLCCCDCGLVHRLDFRVVNGEGDCEFRAYRDNRATGQVRRWQKKTLTPPPPIEEEKL